MTSALIIILREVLEAMLIISLLLAASTNLEIHRRWVVAAIISGMVGAGIYALFFNPISDAFEGVGQEITNAATLFIISISLAMICFIIIDHIKAGLRVIPVYAGIIALFGSIGLAITREGAEIYIYFSGYVVSPEPLQPVLIGGVLGAGIGFSVGALIYYSLKTLGRTASLLISCIVLVPVGAGMVSQGITYLMQADKLPAQSPLWNSTRLVAENSVLGELLYALFSYESTPTPLHVTFYVATFATTLLGMAAVCYVKGNPGSNNLDYV